MTAPLPPNESGRLAALRAFGVLDTPPEAEFDDLTALAAAVCETPIALVSLLDDCRQWFKARVGLDATETPRDVAFCAHAILRDELFVVPDAASDPRFRDNPLVTGGPRIRFYAGMPLTFEGKNLGTLCVIDTVPRTLTHTQGFALRVLARQVVAQLSARKQVEGLSRVVGQQTAEQETFRVLFEQSSDAHLIFDEVDGIIDCNNAAVAMLRCRDKSAVLALHPAVLSPELQPDGRRSMEKCIEMDATARRNGFHRFDWTHRRADGEPFPCEVTITPVELHRRTVLLVVWHDLTERKKAEDALRASEERFQAFMEHTPAMAYMKDEHGRFVFVNGQVCRRFGRPESEWLGHTDADLLGAAVAADLMQVDRRVIETGEAVRVIETAPTPDGLSDLWQSYKFRFIGADNRRYLAGMSVDVTAEARVTEALRASEEKFRLVVDRLAEGLFVVDPATDRIIEANAVVLTMLGYTADEFAALSPTALVAIEPPEVVARNVARIHEALTREGRCDLGRKHLRRKDGSVVPVEVRISLVPAGGAGLHAVIVRDVTEQVESEDRLFEYQVSLEEANAKLKALAITDGLTGVRNRAAFNERLTEEFERALRCRRPASLLLLDVDHFKPFNDTFGHQAGDDVLKVVARTLVTTARLTDFVARYGGEEFAILLPDTDFAGAMVLAERCRRAIATAPWKLRAVTVSIGVATLSADIRDAAELVAQADEALYKSKAAGRNRVQHRSGPIPVTAPRTPTTTT